MSTFWKGLLIAVAVVAVIAIGSFAWLQWRIGQETVTPLATANPDGTAGKALIVYQPGLSSFPERVVSAFADGLVESGWQVSTTTASGEAPAAVAGYDLIVLGSPVYSGEPAKPLARYRAGGGFRWKACRDPADRRRRGDVCARVHRASGG